MKVFITDGGYKHTLAAVRSLGKRGFHVVVGSDSKHSQSFYSKYCKEKLIYPKDEKEFLTFILNYFRKNKIDVVLPVSYKMNTIFSRNKDQISKYVKFCVADYNLMKIFSDKLETVNFAKEIGIDVPKTISASSLENIKKEFKKLKVRFPVVAKGREESGEVYYVNSFEDFGPILKKEKKLILQEYIPGTGYGFFALLDKGEPRAFFMHKRIREYPITGGPSVLAESIYNEGLKKVGLKILKKLKWHGVAMVEFKKDRRDGKFKLMEVNPKFWGSLELAISAGVDFPYLAVKLAAGENFKPVFDYKCGVRFRWLLPGDFLYLFAKPSFFPKFMGDFFRKQIKTDISLNDIKPNLFQTYMTISQVFQGIKNRNIKYPNGKPMI